MSRAKKLNLNHMVANNLFCVLSSWAEQDGERFSKDIKSLNNRQLYEYLDDCIEFEWNEGILICEKEIERRGYTLTTRKRDLSYEIRQHGRSGGTVSCENA